MRITELAMPRERYLFPDKQTTHADVDAFLKAKKAFMLVYNAHPVWGKVPVVQWLQGLYGKDDKAHVEMFGENYLDLDPHPTGLHYDCIMFEILTEKLTKDRDDNQLELF